MIKIVSGHDKQLEISLFDILNCLDSSKNFLMWEIFDFEGVKYESKDLFSGYDNILNFEKATQKGKSIVLRFDDLLKISTQLIQIHEAKIFGYSNLNDPSRAQVQIECFDSYEWTIFCGEGESELFEKLRNKSKSDVISIDN